jgi:hypothetical protein
MGLRVLEVPDGAGEQVLQRLPLCLDRVLVGKPTPKARRMRSTPKTEF